MPLSSQPPGQVFLVDDDSSVRRALRRLIKSHGHLVQTFATAQAFLDSVIAPNGPACLVLDVRMPGLSGMDLQRELQKIDRILPIVFITGYGEIPVGVKAIKAGAVDFLLKPVQAKQLLQAIDQALSRASHELAERRQTDSIRRRIDTLTNRERQVMGLVASGLLNKQIAAKLGTVEKTIKVHRARVLEKMQVQSVAELVHLLDEIGYLAEPRRTS